MIRTVHSTVEKLQDRKIKEVVTSRHVGVDKWQSVFLSFELSEMHQNLLYSSKEEGTKVVREK